MRFLKARPWLAAVLALVLALGIPITASAADMGTTANWAPWASLREIAENPPIIAMGTAHQWSYPDIDGKYAMYADQREDADGTGGGTAPGDWNIYLLNFNTGVETPVDTGAGDQTNPRISGDWIVYESMPASSMEIRAYKISTGARKDVTNRTGAQPHRTCPGPRSSIRLGRCAAL